jgi:hypothetical protein
VDWFNQDALNYTSNYLECNFQFLAGLVQLQETYVDIGETESTFYLLHQIGDIGLICSVLNRGETRAFFSLTTAFISE